MKTILQDSAHPNVAGIKSCSRVGGRGADDSYVWAATDFSNTMVRQDCVSVAALWAVSHVIL